MANSANTEASPVAPPSSSSVAPTEPAPSAVAASSISPNSLLARDLTGQDAVRNFLASAVAQNRVSHAYLFLGSPGSGKLDAAYALSQAVICEQGGCGTCDACIRVAHRSHPDVHLLSPQSASGYLIDQIRDLIEDLSYAPIRARRKIYILDEAESLGTVCANALLKSLEEPPDGVVFILLGTSRDAILPTIVSRCQVVPFRSFSADQALRILSAQLTVPESILRRAIGCCSSPSQAREFARSSERQEARRLALRALEILPNADELDILHAASDAIAAAKVPYKSFQESQKAARKESADSMTDVELRQLDVRQQRELTARERQGTMELFGAQRSLLRDALMIASETEGAAASAAGSRAGSSAGSVAASNLSGTFGSNATAHALVCDDFANTSRIYAERLGLDGVSRAIRCVDDACARVRANVSPQLAMETMLFTIKEMLSCRS